MTSRELVYNTLEHKNTTNKVPRQLWSLPFAEIRFPGMIDKVKERFPEDIGGVPCSYSKETIRKGEQFKKGEYTDEWGCVFTNIHEGVIGEVKAPLVKDENWNDISNIHIPDELLTFDINEVNENCKKTDKFIIMGGCANPFERLQYIRTTENLYCDLLICPENVQKALDKIHTFNCELIEKWCKTDVDAISLMDDWGSMKSLLINPDLWREMFKPLYKEYCNIAKKYNKKVFFHSDGNILEIIPDFIEIGVDALNSQIFLMGIENLVQFKGKITFWGEIDRQHILCNCTEKETKEAVRKVKSTLWQDGGLIAQLEFGPGAKPENVFAAYEAWEE